MFRIICHGWRTVGYGPFKTEAEARNYADKYLQDYRNEFVPYEEPPALDDDVPLTPASPDQHIRK